LLKKVYGDECISRDQVFEWFERFREGREAIGVDRRPVRPSTSKIGANIEKVVQIFRQSRCLSFRAVAELINIAKETSTDFHYNFNMKKLCSKVVPTLLTSEQNEIRMNICSNILQNIDKDPNCLENVITCYESYFSNTTPEGKRQSMHLKIPSSPRQKKARQSISKFKEMVIFFRHPMDRSLVLGA